MAKHRKHRRYRGLMRVGFGLSNPFKSLPASIGTKDTAIGGAVGLAGALVSRYAWNMLAPDTVKAAALATANGTPASPVWAFVHDNLPALGAFAAGAGAYFFGKKKNASKAAAHLVGASLAGGVLLLQQQAQSFLPDSFKGLQLVKLGRAYRALVLRDQDRPAMKGIVLPSAQAQMAGRSHAVNNGRMRGLVAPIAGMRRPA